jgi:hypothetical protein
MVSLADPGMAGRVAELQALDDAIAFRSGRLGEPCAGCAMADQCAGHVRDEELIAGYRRMQAVRFAEVLQGADPVDVALVTGSGDAVPSAEAAVSLVVLAGLRRAAAAGPGVTGLVEIAASLRGKAP